MALIMWLIQAIEKTLITSDAMKSWKSFNEEAFFSIFRLLLPHHLHHDVYHWEERERLSHIHFMLINSLANDLRLSK